MQHDLQICALNIKSVRQMQICMHTLAICMHLTLICMHRTCHEGTRFGTGRGRSNAAEAGGRGLGEDPQNDGQHQNKYINCMSGIVWCAHHLSKPYHFSRIVDDFSKINMNYTISHLRSVGHHVFVFHIMIPLENNKNATEIVRTWNVPVSVEYFME